MSKKIFAFICIFMVSFVSNSFALESTHSKGETSTTYGYDYSWDYDYDNDTYYPYNYNNRNGQYVNDYGSDYYEAVRYLNYNESSCYYNDKGIKYCQANFSEYNYAISTRYDCSYNQQYRAQYCKFPFQRTTRYIGQDYCSDNGYYYDSNGNIRYNCQNYTTTYTNCSWGYQRVGNNCQKIYLPNNAHLTSNGNDWECNTGYYRIGNSCSYSYNNTTYACDWGYKNVNNNCEKIYLPANAHYTNNGTDWACNSGYYKSNNSCISYYNNNNSCDWGYKKVYNGCEKIYLPANAYWTNDGHDWSCNSGYYRNGNYCQKSDYANNTCSWGYKNINGYCQKIYLPDNSHINSSGNDWECNNGYYRSGNYCYSDSSYCHAEYNPVCGTNGVTYSNECKARESGVQISYYGNCR